MDPALAVDIRTAADLGWVPKAAVLDEVVWLVWWWVWERRAKEYDWQRTRQDPCECKLPCWG